MIKISKHIYIHSLTVALFASAYITRTLGITAMMYSVMLLHELSHMFAAIYLRLGISRIILYPFGVSLSVGTRMLCPFSDSLILYLAGPLINAVIALIMAILGCRNLFALNNLAVFVLNILPIIPLDGGRITEALLIRVMGERKCRIMMTIISVIFSLGLLILLILSCSININSLTFIAFIFGGCIMQKPKYNRDFIREITFAEKKTIKSDVFVVGEDMPKRKVVSYFSPNKRAVIFVCDKAGAIKDVKTDTQVISDILN